MFFVISTTPPFEALYAIEPVMPSRPSMLARWMMLPARCASMAGSTCFATRKEPFRLMSTMRSHSAPGSSWARRPPRPTPAAFTSTSMRPSAARAAATASSTCASLRTSTPSRKSAFGAARSTSRQASPTGFWRSIPATLAPSAAKRAAQAAPIPDAAPVTSATLRSRRPIDFLLRRRGRPDELRLPSARCASADSRVGLLRELPHQRLRLRDEAQDLLLAARAEEREPRDPEVAVALRRVQVRARRRRDADLERAELGQPRDGAGRLGERGHVLPRGLEVAAKAVPAVAARDGAAEGRGARSPDYDRRVRLLHRARLGVDAREAHRAAGEARARHRPERADRVDVFVGARAAVLEARADRVELGAEVPRADAEDEPPAREHVEARELLREHQGVALREDDDPRSEADPRGRRRDEGERDRRVEHRVVRRHGRGRGLGVGEHHVLARPERLEAGRLGGARHPRGHLGARARAGVDAEEPDLHPRTSVVSRACPGPTIARRGERRRGWPLPPPSG